MAIAIDDGVDSSVVDAYLDFAEDSGARLTFLTTNCYPSWTDNQNKTRPLAELGQVQLVNHTWTHPDLTTLSKDGIIDELTQYESLLHSTYSVTGASFIQSLYGGRSSYTDSVCVKIGYTTTTMWHGSFGGSGQLVPEIFPDGTQRWLLVQHIIIGHTNLLTVTSVYDQIIDILHQYSLQMAMLDDVYFGPGHSRHA